MVLLFDIFLHCFNFNFPPHNPRGRPLTCVPGLHPPPVAQKGNKSYVKYDSKNGRNNVIQLLRKVW
jgi:hypothetical protein